MATGMEMMVNAILKASGVDPEQVKSDIATYGKQLAEKISSMDSTLSALRNDQAILIDSLRDVSEAIEALRWSEKTAAANGGPHVSRS